MIDKNMNELLKAVEANLRRMCDPNHPVYKIVIERDGYGVDANGQPEVAAFHMKLEHLSAVVHLPVTGVSKIIMPGGPNGGPMRPMPQPDAPMVASDLERAPSGEPATETPAS